MRVRSLFRIRTSRPATTAFDLPKVRSGDDEKRTLSPPAWAGPATMRLGDRTAHFGIPRLGVNARRRMNAGPQTGFRVAHTRW